MFYHELRRRLERENIVVEVLFPEYVKGITKFFNGRFRVFWDGLREAGVEEDDSLFVIFSDHGEAPFGNTFDHSGPLIEGLIRVPLIFYAPGFLAPSRIDGQVSMVDILPTILEMASIKMETIPRSPFQGKSLLSLIMGSPGWGSPAYSEYWSESIGWETMRNKIRRGGISPDTEDKDRFFQRSLRTPFYKFYFPGGVKEPELLM